MRHLDVFSFGHSGILIPVRWQRTILIQALGRSP
jgi:hypothetical protein